MKKYYVVWQGVIPGIYNNWEECKKQVEGFNNAIYRSFISLQEAKKAYFSELECNKTDFKKQFNPYSLSVDAACSGNPGIMEYRGVDTCTIKEKFRAGPYQNGTNNIGEFLAIVHGLAWIKQQKMDIAIYSDSEIAILWVKKKECRTKMKLQNTSLIFQLIQRAEKWLKKNIYTTPVLKWNTKKWGEIPADFGRK